MIAIMAPAGTRSGIARYAPISPSRSFTVMFCVFISVLTASTTPGHCRQRLASCPLRQVRAQRHLPAYRPASLGIEGGVGGKQTMSCAEEGMAAAGRRHLTAERGVGIKHLEIVERGFLQPARFGGRIALHRAMKNLTKAEFYLGGKVRDHAAHVMGDDFQLRKLVEQPAIDQARHAGRGLVRPSETEPDFVLRDLFRGVIGKIRATHGMDPDRQIVLGHASQYWPKFRGA